MSRCGDCKQYEVCKPYVDENETFSYAPGGCPSFRERGVFLRGIDVPIECEKCLFETTVGGCQILNAIGIKASVTEFEEEWHKAKEEHRRLKYCPLEEVEIKRAGEKTDDTTKQKKKKKAGNTDNYSDYHVSYEWVRVPVQEMGG